MNIPDLEAFIAPDAFAKLVSDLSLIAQAVGRSVYTSAPATTSA